MGSNNYLLYPGGGILFKFSEIDNTITRIDRSFAHEINIQVIFFLMEKIFICLVVMDFGNKIIINKI